MYPSTDNKEVNPYPSDPGSSYELKNVIYVSVRRQHSNFNSKLKTYYIGKLLENKYLQGIVYNKASLGFVFVQSQFRNNCLKCMSGYHKKKKHIQYIFPVYA